MLNIQLLILFALISFGSCTNKWSILLNIHISDWTKHFQPMHPIELISSIPAKSLFDCTRYLSLIIFPTVCNVNVLCQTFDYDTSTVSCRLMKGTVHTSSIIWSTPISRVGTFVCPTQSCRGDLFGLHCIVYKICLSRRKIFSWLDDTDPLPII